MKHHPDVLYSAKTEIDHGGTERVRISKFTDGELESSYLTTLYDCECPAGVRPSCRHRQMLPQMQAHRIINTHWFWNFDLNRVVDFSGMLKSNLDALNELAERKTFTIPDGYEAVRDADGRATGEVQRTQSVTEQPLTIEITDGGKPMHLFGAGGIITEYHKQAELARPLTGPKPSWRRI